MSIHASIHMATHMSTYMPIHTCLHTCLHTCPHTCLHIHAYTHTPTHMSTHMSTHMAMHMSSTQVQSTRPVHTSMNVFIKKNLNDARGASRASCGSSSSTAPCVPFFRSTSEHADGERRGTLSMWINDAGHRSYYCGSTTANADEPCRCGRYLKDAPHRELSNVALRFDLALGVRRRHAPERR